MHEFNEVCYATYLVHATSRFNKENGNYKSLL